MVPSLLEKHQVTQGSAGVALEKSHQRPQAVLKQCTCAAHKTGWSGSGDQGRSYTRTDLEKKKSLPKEQCFRFSDFTVRSVSYTDFYLYFRFSSPHFSDYWQFMYTLYYTKLFMQFPNVIQFLWYTSKVKFAFIACLWVCLSPLLGWCYDKSNTHRLRKEICSIK